MVKRSYNTNKKSLGHNNSLYSRQLNKVIFVLITLILIFIIKTINTKTSNDIIQIIEKNIYYDFSWKNDGKKATDYMKKLVGSTKNSIEIFNIQTNKKILNN